MTMRLWDLAGAEDDRRFSPYCWRIKMALRHKGLAAEEIAWRFTDTEAIAFSGQKLVPVLEDHGRVVYDSWDIALYLDQAYAERPLLESEGAKAFAYFLKHWTVANLHGHVSKAVLLDLYAVVHEKDKAYFRASREKRYGMPLEKFCDPRAGVAALRGALDPIRPVFVQHRFLAGGAPGLADYILFGPFQWARAVSPLRLLEPDDPVYAWRERMLDLFGGYARAAKGYPVWA
ncbi:MAG TPA: glutathione S-transferase N-terminal domain-containing protein [Burkholderiales bacterium]